LIDLLVTRGEGPVDEHQFARELMRGFADDGLESYAIEKVDHLALTERAEVKDAACYLLWGYSRGARRDYAEKAASSFNTAGCTCATASEIDVCRTKLIK
jgi:hypothetical protein